MTKFAAIAVFVFTNAVLAQTPTPKTVWDECIRQMNLGICRASPIVDPSKPNQTIILSGVGRVSYSAYADYMKLLNPKNPNDSAMCELALHYMNTEPGSDHDKIARALWSPPKVSTEASKLIPTQPQK